MALIFPLVPPTWPGPRSLKIVGNKVAAEVVSTFTGEGQVQEWAGEWLEIEATMPPMPRPDAENWVAFLLALRGGNFVWGDPIAANPRGSLARPTFALYGSARSGNNVLLKFAANIVGGMPSWIVTGLQIYVSGVGPGAGSGGVGGAGLNGGPFALNYVNAAYQTGGFPLWAVGYTQAGIDTTGGGGLITASGAAVNGAVAALSPTLPTKGWAPNAQGILLRGDYVQVGAPNGDIPARLHKLVTDANADAGGLATLDIFPTIREPLSDGRPLVLSNTLGTFRLAEYRHEWTVDYTMTYGLTFKAKEAL